VAHCLRTSSSVAFDLVSLAFLAVRSHDSLAAENLFLRKQLALFQERKGGRFHSLVDGDAEPNVSVAKCAGECQAGHAHSLATQRIPALLALEVEAQGTSKPARESAGTDPKMAADNVSWGEERIANELKLKLGIRVSPRTVGKYLRNGGPVRTPDPQQRWLTLVHNHAKGIVACDFFVVVYSHLPHPVFVIMELGTRRILNQNVTAHPTAEWTLQKLREALPGNHPYRFVFHDRDCIFSKALDQGVTDLGIRVLRTRVRAPLANSVCERLGGSLRRECLDFVIPFSERHLKMMIQEWVTHYNRGRPHSALDFRNPPRPTFRTAGTDTNCLPAIAS
jgi:putative transposase